MKSFLKILFVLLAIFQANVSEAKVFLFSEATVLHTFNLEKSSAELQSVILENDIANTCKSESDLVAYKNWSISYNAVAAKEGSSIFSYITPKITKQMAGRGWTQELIHNTVNNPFTTRVATNRATGNAATAFFQKNGAYVVKDNVTNQVIQISNKLDPKWIPDATIINPFIPK